jgi:hypothetical protein
MPEFAEERRLLPFFLSHAKKQKLELSEEEETLSESSNRVALWHRFVSGKCHSHVTS